MHSNTDPLTLTEFLALPLEEVRRLVQARAPRLSVAMPLNGSRRTWRIQQRSRSAAELDPSQVAIMLQCMNDTLDLQLAVHRLILSHGVHTLFASVVGDILQARSSTYAQAAIPSLELLLDPRALALYQEFDLQVHFFGNYVPIFQEHGRPDIPERYAELTRATAHCQGGRLLYGLWVPEIGEAEIETANRFYAEHGRAGSRAELIQAFYGIDIDWLDAWFGFNKPKVYDVPLIFGRHTNLYFTVTPTAALSQIALRKMLYDMLYARPAKESSSFRLSSQAVEQLAAYYAANAGEVAGVGQIDPDLGCWVPVLDHLPPAGFAVPPAPTALTASNTPGTDTRADASADDGGTAVTAESVAAAPA